LCAGTTGTAPRRTTPVRFNEGFDFIGIRADSVVLATVMDQATIIDAVASMRLSRVRRRSAWA
jgi:hypothetical protein